MTERLKENPQDQQDNKSALAIRNLLAASPEDLSKFWQNRTFLFEFPALAIYLIGSKGRTEFSEDQRADLFSLSLTTFLFNKDRKLSGGYAFTQDGQVVSRNKDERTDSLTKALTASILLIGMSLPDKEIQSSLLIKTYQDMDQNRKSNLLSTLGRLLAKNNITRTWIKENRIDADNGFDWDSELSRLLFFGIYASAVEHFYIPKDMRQDVIKDFSLEARRVILNFALEYADKLKKSRFSPKLWDFTVQMKAMEMTEDMRKQLSLFEQKVGFKMAIA